MENKQKEKLRKLGLSEDQVEGVQRLIENQEHFKMNEGVGDDYDDPKTPFNIPLIEAHMDAPEKFLGIDMDYVQQVYDEVVLIIAFELNNKDLKNKVNTIMKEKLPYYDIKCDEENNPIETVASGNLWVRVTDPETNNYVDLVF